MQSDSNLAEQQKSENTKLQRELIDDSFYVEQNRFKLWNSYDKDDKSIITSLTKEKCISATRFYLKGKQEGFDENSGMSYDGTVGGKL